MISSAWLAKLASNQAQALWGVPMMPPEDRHSIPWSTLAPPNPVSRLGWWGRCWGPANYPTSSLGLCRLCSDSPGRTGGGALFKDEIQARPPCLPHAPRLRGGPGPGAGVTHHDGGLTGRNGAPPELVLLRPSQPVFHE